MSRSDENLCARARARGNYPRYEVALLLALLTPACGDVQVDATARAAENAGGAAPLNQFTETFDLLDANLWSCEYDCPTVSGGAAHFSLLPGIQPENQGSWSKIDYKPQHFTEGSFSVSFALGPRPAQSVFWGVALWDPGPNPDESQYNEINFGYTTDGANTNTQLELLSARLGQKLTHELDAGVDLYDGAFHIGKLTFDSAHVALDIDGKRLDTITDPRFIPTAPLTLILGTRLVTAPVLTSRFDQVIDSCGIEW